MKLAALSALVWALSCPPSNDSGPPKTSDECRASHPVIDIEYERCVCGSFKTDPQALKPLRKPTVSDIYAERDERPPPGFYDKPQPQWGRGAGLHTAPYTAPSRP